MNPLEMKQVSSKQTMPSELGFMTSVKCRTDFLKKRVSVVFGEGSRLCGLWLKEEVSLRAESTSVKRLFKKTGRTEEWSVVNIVPVDNSIGLYT